ncbi:hypothetical protein NHX12_021215 [Muraenolepis orangiensis]|uniref:Retinoic acid receptor responder protein 2 n=1 Tax=Muraenolepis orangiensis TaxID=630683 RepID=A0A9Q0IU94_9TELE|nr:hypothetical protein NHX12_021215 [Muraenolepis orangiensis]
MAALFLWLLLAAGALLPPAEAQEEYDRLPNEFKKAADLGLAQQNSRGKGKHHFLYFKSLMRSDIQPGSGVLYLYHHFYLKATRCPKGTVDTSNCPFRTNRPEIDCAVCYKAILGTIQAWPEPYVSCTHKPALTEAKKNARVDHCNRMGYSSGAPGGMADPVRNDPPFY